MANAVCPECHTVVTVDAASGLGQRAECPACHADLEVVSLQPLELDWRFEEPLPRAGQLEETAA